MSLANKRRMMQEAADAALRQPRHERKFEPRVEEAAPNRFLTGKLLNLENLFLRWVDEDWFEYLPHPDVNRRFGFRRVTGELVTPGHMFTNGGSIPRQLWWMEGLAPWDYAPAYLVHDWEFDLHHSGQTQKSFEDVRDTMMEALMTLMATGTGKDRPVIAKLIHAGIDSQIARDLWNSRPGTTLPEAGT